MIDPATLDHLEDWAEPEEPIGSLAVLNCGAGDLRFSFDPGKPEEIERAKGVIADMLKRGYILMIEVNGKWRRAKGFDPARCEYLVADVDPGEDETEAAEKTSKEWPEKIVVQNLKKKRGRPKGVPAKGVRAISVAPTSGG